MPIYEYKCADCGKEFEELVFSTDECPPCPECSSENTSKLMSACRAKMASGGGAPADDSSAPAPSVSSSPCAGCSGGNCSSCG